MLLKDVPWVKWDTEGGVQRRWRRTAEFTQPNGRTLKIWQGEHFGETQYCINWDHKPPGTEGRRHDVWQSELNALEAQCLLFHYLGGNDG